MTKQAKKSASRISGVKYIGYGRNCTSQSRTMEYEIYKPTTPLSRHANIKI